MTIKFVVEINFQSSGDGGSISDSWSLDPKVCQERGRYQSHP